MNIPATLFCVPHGHGLVEVVHQILLQASPRSRRNQTNYKRSPRGERNSLAASEPMYTTLTCSFPATTTVNMLIPLIPSLPCLPLFPFNLLWFVSDCVDVCVDVWVNVCIDVCFGGCIGCVEGCVEGCVVINVHCC